MACVGQVFPWCTLPTSCHPGIYTDGRISHLITVHGLFLLENAFLNSFIILASTSFLAMISTIPLGEKLVLWYHLFITWQFGWVPLSFLGCIHLLYTAQDFMCLQNLFAFFLLYFFQNIRVARITLCIQTRRTQQCVCVLFFPQKSAF